MSNEKLHNEAMAIFHALKSSDSRVVAAKQRVANYDQRRKEMTAQLKQIFAAMQEKFEAGEQIAGCSSVKEYCKAFKPSGCLTYARVRQILTGKSGNENKKRSSQPTDLTRLEDGTVVTVAIYIGDDESKKYDRKFRVVTVPEGDAELTGNKDDRRKRFGNVILEMIEEEKPEPVITHGRLSARRSVCESVFVNRPKIKGKVFAVSADDATCPDCRRALDENKNKTGSTKYVPPQPKKSVVVPERTNGDGSENTDIWIKLTSAQYREAGQIARDMGIGWAPAVTLVFEADEYQTQAKELVVALEQRVTDLNAAHDKWRNSQNSSRLRDLLDWNNKEPKAQEAKKVQSTWKGAVKACEGAIQEIIFGDKSDDPARSIVEWYSGEHSEEIERQAEEKYQKRIKELDAKRNEMPEPAKDLAAAVDGASNPYSNLPEADRKWMERTSAAIRSGTYHPFSACPGKENDEPGVERIDDEPEEEVV